MAAFNERGKKKHKKILWYKIQSRSELDFGRRKSVEHDPWDSPGKLVRLMLTKVNLKQSKTFQITGKKRDWLFLLHTL